MNRDVCEHATPVQLKCDECDAVELNNLKTLVFHLGEDKKELIDANTKLAGAINLIRETLNGGEVQDLHQIINAALDAHEESKTPNAEITGG